MVLKKVSVGGFAPPPIKPLVEEPEPAKFRLATVRLPKLLELPKEEIFMLVAVAVETPVQPPAKMPIGATAGVTLFDAALSGPKPIALVAATVNVYGVPFVRPVTLKGDAAPVAVMPPGDDVAR
jgi:hypothetical protein